MPDQPDENFVQLLVEGLSEDELWRSLPAFSPDNRRSARVTDLSADVDAIAETLERELVERYVAERAPNTRRDGSAENPPSGGTIRGGTRSFAVGPSYWAQVKLEFRDLVCTNSAKFAALRRQVHDLATKGQAALISMVSSTMAALLGVAAGIIAPLVTLCLIVLLRLGKEAYCAMPA
jgi:hypothetical protein